VSGDWQLYATVLLIYFGIYSIGCLALTLQFGSGGLINFGFILFQAVGAYTAAVLTLGPATDEGFQQYIGGAELPFPLPIVGAAVMGALVSLVVGVIGLRRLRRDYEAIVMLVVMLIALSIATNFTSIVNGANGLSTVPRPLAENLDLNPYGLDYQWFYVLLVLIFTAIVFWIVHRLITSPFGRTLRAVRDNEAAAAALGKDVRALRLKTFMIGGALAAVSGALLVQFITSWAPTNWTLAGTFLFFAAVIVGGSGSSIGAVMGAALVPVVFIEAVRFIPSVSPTVEAMRWVVIGLLVLAFLWFRPRGLVPERPRQFRSRDTSSDGNVPAVAKASRS
jgi:branched-chain amino acid transport system permease protein